MVEASEFKEAPLGNGSIEVGRFTYGYEGITCREWGEGANVTIGSFCSISDNVQILLGGQHRIDWITTFPFGQVFEDEFGGEEIEGHPQSNGDVSIGSDVWIGSGTTILSGVNIADGAVIGANSTVTKDVGPYEIWAGNPAVCVRKRFDDEIIAALMDLKWWNLPEELIKEMAPLLCMQPNKGLLEGLKAVVDDLVVFENEDAA